VSPEAAARVDRLKATFLTDHPQPDPEAAAYWDRYQQLFSATGLPTAPPADLKSFTNISTGANPGNMSVFNRAWNEPGDESAADRFRRSSSTSCAVPTRCRLRIAQAG